MLVLLPSVILMTLWGAVCLLRTGAGIWQVESLAGYGVHVIKNGPDVLDEDGELVAVGMTEEDEEDAPEGFFTLAQEDEDDEDSDDAQDDAEDEENQSQIVDGLKNLESRNPVKHEKEKQEKEKKKKEKKKKEQEEEEQNTDYLNPQWKMVNEDYFRDALFIGDSRQLGFGMYCGLPDITVYAKSGYQIFTAATNPIVETLAGRITVAQALLERQGQFKKVYLMFGLNEMGMKDDDTLDSYYYNLIDYVKQTQPDAIIYLESVIHVTSKKAASSKFTNEKINERNERLKAIAANEHIYYLDLNEVFTDAEGALQADAASDGVHMKSAYIQVWKQYLMAHGIIR